MAWEYEDKVRKITAFDTVELAERTKGYETETIYVATTDTYYEYTITPQTRDGLHVLNSYDGNYWIGVSGKYSLQNIPGSITTTTELDTAIAQIEDSISSQTMTGFVSWDSAGPYYSIAGNDLTLLVSGKGRIRGKEYSWSSPQTITLPINQTSFVYINTSGLIGIVDAATLALYQDNIVLFEALNEGTEIDVVRENHPYNFGTVESSRHLHLSIGTIFVPPTYDSRAIGANPARITTGTGGAVTDREIKLVGNAYLEDHGIYTYIPDSANNPITWRFFYTDSLGKWRKYATQSQFPMVYNNAGTVTALPTSGTNHVGIFRIYASKDDPNTGIPFYFVVINITAYDNVIQANNAVADGLPAIATNELSELEVSQIGYIIVENNATSGYIREVVIEKQTNTGGVTVSGPLNSHILLTDKDAIDSHPSYAISHTRIDTVLETVEDSLHRQEYISADSMDPNGFVNQTDSVMIWNHTTRTMSIQPAITQYEYWHKGLRYIETTLKTLQISTLNGLHYIYFIENQALFDDEYPPTDQIIKGVVLAMIVYWNNTQGIAPYVGDERHGMSMSWSTHDHEHFTYGARYKAGLELDNFIIGDGSLDAHAQFDCTDGSIKDEDIDISIVDGSPQQLTPILQAPVYFRIGTDLWFRSEADNFPIMYSGKQAYVGGSVVTYYTGANSRPAYNQLVGVNWQLTEIGQDDLFLIHLFATNDIYNPVVAILGTNVYTKLKDAQNAAYSEIKSLTGLPFPEFTPIGTIIYQGNNTFANAPNARIVTTDSGAYYIDFRDTRAFQGISATLPTFNYGIYTPTLTGITNVTSSTAYECGYIGVGQEISVSRMRIDVIPTTTGTTRIRASLPVASTIIGVYHLEGSGEDTPGTTGASVQGDTTNNEALIEFTASTATLHTFHINFGYRIQ